MMPFGRDQKEYDICSASDTNRQRPLKKLNKLQNGKNRNQYSNVKAS